MNTTDLWNTTITATTITSTIMTKTWELRPTKRLKLQRTKTGAHHTNLQVTMEPQLLHPLSVMMTITAITVIIAKTKTITVSEWLRYGDTVWMTT